MNRLSKTLAPIAAIAILGSSAAPAFAADGNMQGNAQSSTVSLYSAESTLPAAVTAPSDSNARVITTLADATAAAQVAKDAPQTESQSTTIEDALKEKFSQKENEKHDAKVKAQTEKAQADAKKAEAKKKADAKKAEAKQKAEAKKVASVVKKDAESDSEAATVPVAAPATGVGTDASDAYNVDADIDVDNSDDVVVDASSYDSTDDGSTIETPSYTYNGGGTYTPTPVYGGGNVEAQTVVSTQAKKPVKRAVVKRSSSTTNQKIYKAAMAQLGKRQDCTMLVTNSLKSVGIKYHDWPAGYKKLGKVVPRSQAKAGDLIYYRNGGMGLAHIAVYAGNGKAVHGGWNGNQTVLQTANVGYGAEYIRVSR